MGKVSKAYVKKKHARLMAKAQASGEAAAQEEQQDAAQEDKHGDLIKPMQLQQATSEKKMTNRQKCLVLGSRNMSGKDRHLLVDLRGLMPHAREHAKLEARDDLGDRLTELAAMYRCNTVMFVEARKHETAFLWLAQAPAGPSVRFELVNVHTADELRMAGNCLKFSRPLIHFDKEFETHPHLRVIKSLLHQTFNTPRYHPLSKPFVDHVISFHFLDGRIWFRNYQIVDTTPMQLMEIGPRFALNPLTILNGCVQGAVLWKNLGAQSPTEVRKTRKLRLLQKQQENESLQQRAEKHREKLPAAAPDPLDSLFK